MNTADRALVELLARNDSEIFHFGDLDPGGLAIFSSLREAASGKLKPYKMDLATYERYLPHGYGLTRQALKLLDRIDLPEIEGLRDAMKRTGLGIEQEIIDISR